VTKENNHYKYFQNKECPFWMCHSGVKEENFSCLFCYCPLIAYKCPGPYEVFHDKNGKIRKDCSACKIPHDGYEKSWNIMQKYLKDPEIWMGESAIAQKHAQEVEYPREETKLPFKEFQGKIRDGATVELNGILMDWPDIPGLPNSESVFNITKRIEGKAKASAAFGSFIVDLEDVIPL
jgi:Zn-finger protein